MDDFDIYSDLPDFAWLKQEYEADVEVEKQEQPLSEKEVIELKTRLLKLEKVHKLVLSHYSSLWKTAKIEKKRMDRQIAELRSQLDNLAFKRHHRHQNVAHRPTPTQPMNVRPAIKFPAQSNNGINYPPPPLMGTTFPTELQTNRILFSYPPPPIYTKPTVDLTWSQRNEKTDVHFGNSFAVPSNVITPDNSHSSGESEEDIVKKSQYRSTVYGERLRKKLLEEKKLAAKQKRASALREKKVFETKLEQKELTAKELNDDKKPSNVNKSSAKESHKEEQELQDENKVNVKENKKSDELYVRSEGEVQRKDSEDPKVRTVDDVDKRQRNVDFEISREKDIDKRKEIKRPKTKWEIEMERKRENEMRIKRERDTERRQKDHKFEWRKKEEIDSRRREEIERRRRRNVEESQKRRREDVDRKRNEEEIERRRRDDIEKRRREELDRKKKEESIERKRKDDIDCKRKEEAEKRRIDEDKKRITSELQVHKERENDQRKKEEEHAKKLQEIERKRNEQQLEELIKERKRIEEEMSTFKEDDTEEEGKLASSKDLSCKEQSKEYIEDASKQCQKSQFEDRRNNDYKTGERSSRNNSFRATNQCEKNNHHRRNAYHQDAGYRTCRNQDSRISLNKRKHDDRPHERRESSSRSKSRSRNKSHSGHQSDDDRNCSSSKRMKRQENDRDHRDSRLTSTESDRKYKNKKNFNEKSDQRNRTSIIPGETHSLNKFVKTNENNVEKINFPISSKHNNGVKIRENGAIFSNCTKRIPDGSGTYGFLEHVTNIPATLKESKEELIGSNKMTDSQKVSQNNKEHAMDRNGDQDNLSTLTNKDVVDGSSKMDTSDLEEGEITDSDESMNSENLPKSMHSSSTDKPAETMELSSEQSLAIENGGNTLDRVPRENHVESVSKCSSENSILYNILTQSKSSTSKEGTTTHIATKADHTASRIVDEKQFSVNSSASTERETSNNGESVESKIVKDNNTTSEPSRTINATIEKEKQNDVEMKDCAKNDEVHLGNATKNVSRQDGPKENSRGNVINDKEEPRAKKPELRIETNNTKNAQSKEKVDASNGNHVEKLVDESASKPNVSLEKPTRNSEAGKRVNSRLTKAPSTVTKNIIVVRRRKKPVQLGDSREVVVIGNANKPN